MKTSPISLGLAVFLSTAATAACATAAPRPVLLAQEGVDATIMSGRLQLERGDAEGALATFEKAVAMEAGTLRTQMWLPRAWMDLGRTNDAYNAIDELAKTHKGLEIDYLYGMAFATDAKRGIESGQAGPMTGEKIQDALHYLSGVVNTNAQAFPDAVAMLCWTAWELQRLEDGRAAAVTYTKVRSNKADAHYQLGRFALAQYQRDQADEAKKNAAEQHWLAAKNAFDAAGKLLEGKSEPADRALLARVSIDLGHVHVWKKELDQAAAQYGKGFGLDPTIANYGQILGVLGQEKMLAALELGATDFVKHWGAENPADATLLWWLGWTRLQQKQYETAESAFASSVKKFPAYVNCWLYIAVCRFSRQDKAGAVEAIKKHHEANATDLAAAINQNPAYNLAMLDSLVGFCASKDPVRNLDAAILSEAQALAKPDEIRYWNNAGLFYRDAGEPLGRSKDETKRKQAMEHFEKAYACYSRALELEPDDPAILNDTAVMLHYYLDRELERAKEMYRRSNIRAKELLDKGGLDEERKDLYQIALRDSGNNLRKLEAGIKTN